MRSSARIAAALAVVALAVPSSAAELLERVVAVVDGRALYLSDVRAIERIDAVAYALAVERLVDETLLFHEAFRVPQAALTGAEEKALADETAGDIPARRLQQRRAVIRKYVAFRFRPQVRIEDDALRQAYDEEVAAGHETAPFESAASGLRERMIARELEVRVTEWVRDLRVSAVVLYNPPEED